MKTLLLGTAIAAVASTSFAHDNFKTQLDNLNNSWECQDHFDRGDAVAGNIDEFEFCVWYLNNNKEAFTRDLHWYSILPSGDIVAVKKNLLTSDHKAKSVIETAVHKIIVANLKKEHAANVAAIEAENSKIVSGLNNDIDTLKTELANIATTLSDRDPAEVIAELKELGDAVVALTESRDNLQDLFDAANDGITQETVNAIKAELNEALEIQKGLVEDKAAELIMAKADLMAAQGVIDGLAELRDELSGKNTELQNTINTLTTERDGLKATVDSLNTQLEGFNIEFSETVLQDIYNAGYNSVDQDAIFADGAASRNGEVANLTELLNQAIALRDANAANATAWFEEAKRLEELLDNVDITSDNAQAISEAVEAALVNAPDHVSSKAQRLILMEKARGGNQVPGSLRVSYTTVNTSAETVKVTVDYGWNHSNGSYRTNAYTATVNNPTHFDFDYNAEGKAQTYYGDGDGFIQSDVQYNDDRSQGQTVYYSISLDYGATNYSLAYGNDLSINASNIETLASSIAEDFIQTSFENGYLAGYGDGYVDGYDDGYQDGYADGFRDGVNSVN